MSYEQEKHKLFKTFQKSEKQKQDILKLKNMSLIIPARGSLNSAKQLLVPASSTIIPVYNGRPTPPIISFPENGTTYGHMYPQGFEANYENVHIRFSGNGVNTDRKATGDYTGFGWSFPFTLEEAEAMDYGCSYSVQMRGWDGHFWSDWSPTTVFNTFSYVTPPEPRTNGLYLLHFTGQPGDPSYRMWTYNDIYHPINNPTASLSGLGIGSPSPHYRLNYDDWTEVWSEVLNDRSTTIRFGEGSVLFPGGYVILSVSGGSLYCELYLGAINLYLLGIDSYMDYPYDNSAFSIQSRATIYGTVSSFVSYVHLGYSEIFTYAHAPSGSSSSDVIPITTSGGLGNKYFNYVSFYIQTSATTDPETMLPVPPTSFIVAKSEVELFDVTVVSGDLSENTAFYL